MDLAIDALWCLSWVVAITGTILRIPVSAFGRLWLAACPWIVGMYALAGHATNDPVPGVAGVLVAAVTLCTLAWDLENE